MKHHLAIGQLGEHIAKEYLERAGYLILETNWRFSRAEIDIIAQKKGWIIFCEVKTRTGTLFGLPEISVDKRKQNLMVDAAIVYLEKNQFSGEFRFDIIGIVLKNQDEYAIRHFEDAFFPGL